jgi:hypothetical protein
MSKLRMLVEHKTSFFLCVFDSVKGFLSTTSCCEVCNEKKRRRKLKITDNQTDNKTKQENMIKHFR